ncbi:antibiotic biosynthesis monooxygenase [Cohnella sp. REN36]|uniref:antibiotic biosynthesis monooxygenase n=1 Tax=Cohnella sp. REN36 TaxID=2887347 RepID=UPI001D13453F|nr:antibiotic biosynthesis monooxygenase [Cohnella sp. REN36]MCC3371705.1 antibiotic biosynthesis monooxygenase [Cohnella sp. REN36]
MIVATNTIKIQSGHADAVAERFKNPKGVHQAPGFVRMELLKSEEEGYDELKVCTTWESREAFDAWVNSDAFKQAHARPSAASGGQHSAGSSATGGHYATGGEHAASSASPGGHGAHSGGTAPQGGQPASVMLGSKLSVHEVLFTLST